MMGFMKKNTFLVTVSIVFACAIVTIQQLNLGNLHRDQTNYIFNTYKKPEAVYKYNRFQHLQPLEPTHYNYVAIINTPKCGTVGLWEYFMESYHCHSKVLPHTEVGPIVFETDVEGCPNGYVVQRGHLIEPSAEALTQNFNFIQNSDKEIQKIEDKKCLVVSAIRDPQAWLASVFMEKYGSLCEDAMKGELKPKQALKIYKEWLQSDSRLFYHREIHFLMLEFGAKSLMEEMNIVKQNGGFSFYTHPSKTRSEHEQLHMDNEIRNMKTIPSPFAPCDLLFLRLEDHENWPKILEKVVDIPENAENKYHYQQPVTREDICPALLNHYRLLKSYKMTEEEKANVIGDIPFMAAWFKSYGY